MTRYIERKMKYCLKKKIKDNGTNSNTAAFYKRIKEIGKGSIPITRKYGGIKKIPKDKNQWMNRVETEKEKKSK